MVCPVKCLREFFFIYRKSKHRWWVCLHMLLDLLLYLHYLFVCTSLLGCVSHPNRTLVSRVRGRHGNRATPPLGHAGALEHAGIEACMSAGMFRQVVAPHEALIAQGAVKALLASVCAVVTR